MASDGGDRDGGGTLGIVRLWTLAAGGMVGGGIYIALGVVISVAAQWAWLSFVIAGFVAVVSAYSYAALSNKFRKSGGAFEFLAEMDRKGLAGSLSWLLIIGYTLTIAVYAYAFGHYVAYALGGGAMAIRALAIVAGVGLIGLNLLGLGKMTSVEVVIVAGNLLIICILAAIGLSHWSPIELSAGIEPRPPYAALIGAAAIFVSYEGFQLLTYEYEEVKRPEKIFTPVLVSAAMVVVGVYVAVALGATMIAGSLTIIESKQVALSVAAQMALGKPGLVVLTIAAGFATAAAINSTLFSSAKLVRRIARDGELPKWFDSTNRFDVPGRPIVIIGAVATFLAVVGSLSSLVEAASLVFLATFGVVNAIYLREFEAFRWIVYAALAVGLVIGLVLIARLLVTATLPLAILLALAGAVFLLRPMLLKRFATETCE